jgi:hypothetical protein
LHIFPDCRGTYLFALGFRVGSLWLEEIDMNVRKKMATAAFAGAAVFVMAAPASAAIVCSRDVCWHTHEAYDYPPKAKVVVHEDSWKWGPTERFTFREHEGRGYWRGKDWVGW